jgi:hypothetical protein
MLVRVPVFYWYGDTDAEQARRLAICLRAAFEELLEDARVVWTDTDQVTYEGDMEEWDFHAVYDEALDQALFGGRNGSAGCRRPVRAAWKVICTWSGTVVRKRRERRRVGGVWRRCARRARLGIWVSISWSLKNDD